MATTPTEAAHDADPSGSGGERESLLDPDSEASEDGTDAEPRTSRHRYIASVIPRSLRPLLKGCGHLLRKVALLTFITAIATSTLWWLLSSPLPGDSHHSSDYSVGALCLGSLCLIHRPPPSSPGAAVSSSSRSDLVAAIDPWMNPQLSSLCMEDMRGQWGNHAYQLMMMVKIAVRHRLRLHIPQHERHSPMGNLRRMWRPCPDNLPKVDMHPAEDSSAWSDVDPHTRAKANPFYVGLQGAFQFHSLVYKPWEAQIRALLQPDDDALHCMNAVKRTILISHCSHSLIVPIHMREGDFARPQDVKGEGAPMVRIPVSWFVQWLERLQKDLPSLEKAKRWQDQDCPIPVLPKYTGDITVLLISDERNMEGLAVPFTMAGFNVTTVPENRRTSFGSYMVEKPVLSEYFEEWWMLGQFHVLATSHSSFSRTAAMMSSNPTTTLFYAPDPVLMTIAPFQPWNASFDARAFGREGHRILTG